MHLQGRARATRADGSKVCASSGMVDSAHSSSTTCALTKTAKMLPGGDATGPRQAALAHRCSIVQHIRRCRHFCARAWHHQNAGPAQWSARRFRTLQPGRQGCRPAWHGSTASVPEASSFAASKQEDFEVAVASSWARTAQKRSSDYSLSPDKSRSAPPLASQAAIAVAALLQRDRDCSEEGHLRRCFVRPRKRRCAGSSCLAGRSPSDAKVFKLRSRQRSHWLPLSLAPLL